MPPGVKLGRVKWSVLRPATSPRRQLQAGNFTGAQAEAAVTGLRGLRHLVRSPAAPPYCTAKRSEP